MRPALLVDVDGVLNPYTLNYLYPNKHDVQETDVNGVIFKRHTLMKYQVWLSTTHGEWLNELADLYELFWFTSWEDNANEFIAPIIGLPNLPVIDMPPFKNKWTSWKMPAIIDWADNNARRFVWIDDDIGHDAMDWARDRDDILFQRINPNTGITKEDINILREFALEG